MAGQSTAIVLFNLGGPDSPAAVEPFLFNLFNDPAIIALPQPLRRLVAKVAARRRAPVARAIYDKLGGASPILPQTEAQAGAIEQAVGGSWPVRVFIGMRYWRPFIAEAAAQIRAWQPDRIVLLPLYPQFSTTTTGSSLAAWRAAARQAGLTVAAGAICCYPAVAGFVAAQAALIGEALTQAAARGRPRVLFSAHGLPEKVLKRGDPYRWQVEQSAAAAAAALAGRDFDWVVCYQSRVGPLTWIGPSTEAEIERAGRDQVPVVVAPIAFVSEHSETLVELDIEYAERARAAAVPGYFRVPAVGVQPAFIAALVALARSARPGAVVSGTGKRICPAEFRACPCTA